MAMSASEQEAFLRGQELERGRWWVVLSNEGIGNFSNTPPSEVAVLIRNEIKQLRREARIQRDAR